MKVTPDEIIRFIKKNKRTTVAKLAKRFKVCEPTIRKRLQVLREDEEKIFFDLKGYYYLETIDNEDDYDNIRKYMDFMMSVYIGVAKCSVPSKLLISDSKKMLKKLLTKEQRLLLAKHNMKVNRIIDYITLEEEMED